MRGDSLESVYSNKSKISRNNDFNLSMNQSDIWDISKMIQEDLQKIGEYNASPVKSPSKIKSNNNKLEKIHISPEKLKIFIKEDSTIKYLRNKFSKSPNKELNRVYLKYKKEIPNDLSYGNYKPGLSKQ